MKPEKLSTLTTTNSPGQSIVTECEINMPPDTKEVESKQMTSPPLSTAPTAGPINEQGIALLHGGLPGPLFATNAAGISAANSGATCKNAVNITVRAKSFAMIRVMYRL